MLDGGHLGFLGLGLEFGGDVDGPHDVYRVDDVDG